MNSEWQVVSIGDLCTGIFDGPHATPKKTTTGPIFLGIDSLVGGRIDLSAVEHLCEDDFARWTRRVTPQEGDVVFSYETRLGEAALVPEGLKCCLGRRMALMRPDPSKVVSRFLLYAYLSSEFQNTIRSRTIQGSTVDRIPLKEFPSFPIRVPPLDEQRRIAGVLGVLDDKIEHNRRLAKRLAEMEVLLFRRALAGAVEVVRLGDLIELKYGKALREAGRRFGRVEVFGSNGPVGYHDEALVPGPGIVVGRKGRPGAVHWAHADFFPIDTTFYVVRKPNAPSLLFLFHALSGIDFAPLNADSAVPGLNRTLALDVLALVPSHEAVSAFDAAAWPLREQQRRLEIESRTLEVVRDGLLPKLLLGQIRVPGSYEP